MLLRVLALTAISSAGFAQVSPQGVVSGYTLDGRSNTLRPLLGIPGAAYLGAPLSLPWGVTAAAIRSTHDVAVVISNEQPRQTYILHSLAGATTATQLTAATPDSDGVYLSADGSTAAVVFSAQGQLQIVSNIAQAPAVTDPVLLGLRGNIRAVAVSNSGCALIAGADDHSGQVVETCAATPGSMVTIYDMDAFQPTALAWLGNQKAAVADAASNQLLLFPNMDGSAPTVLLGPSSGISSPVGVAAVNASTVAVANTGGSALVISPIDGSQPPTTVPLPMTPTMLDTLDTPATLVSNALVNAPLLLVAPGQNYAVFFVPMN